MEVVGLAAREHRDAADCVAAVFHATAVVDAGDGRARLTTTPFGRELGIAPEERFHGQPAGALATAFLAAPDLMVTAGHVVDRLPVRDMRFVFGFRLDASGEARVSVPLADVYAAEEVVASRTDDAGADWAVVRLARGAEGRPLPALRRGREVRLGEPLYTIGHPRGLPAKFADNAVVRVDTHPDYFVANLDTYVHCSGSPVFGGDHQVVGVVCRGKQDLRTLPGTRLRVSNVVPDDGGRGEDCTRVSRFAGLIPVELRAGSGQAGDPLAVAEVQAVAGGQVAEADLGGHAGVLEA